MTRRVRFSPLSSVGTFAVAAAISCGGRAAAAADIPFAPPAAIFSSPGAQPGAMAAGDLDRDGDLDIVATGLGASLVAWLENDGDGSTWTLRSIAPPAAGGAIRVAVADVDGDGDSDVVATGSSIDTVGWYENTAGNGSAWTRRTVSTAMPGAWEVATADFDHDGDMDVLSSQVNFGLLVWHENEAGNGTVWTDHTIRTDVAFARSIGAADVDRDGDADVLVASVNDQTVAWYQNLLGDGSVWVKRTVSSGLSGPMEASAVDVDDDGDVDVAVVRGDGIVTWHENADGQGMAWTTHTISTSTSSPFSSALDVRDLDGDGDADVVAIGGSAAVLAWYENVDGAGSTWTARTISTTPPGPPDVLAADLDGDGDPDIASLADFGGEIAWHRNGSIHPTACFETGSTISTVSQPFGTAIADLDRDGDLDAFLIARGPQTANWLRNEGAGTAWTPFTIGTGFQSFTVNAADVDGDGDADALLPSQVSQPAMWIENVSNAGAWLPQPVATAGAPPIADLRGADMDGDGDVDALASASNVSPLVWYENANGQGDVWTPHTIAAAAQGTIARPVDVDRDGDVDVLGFGSSSLPLVWYENAAGNGSAWTIRTISTHMGFASAVAFDVDEDGDVDVVESNLTSVPGLYWHENLAGNGSSWAPHTLPSPIDAATLEAHDIDRDGDLDLVLSNGANAAWLERNGPGVAFVLHTLASAIPGVVTAGDLDRDGDPDLLWSEQTNNLVRWSRNGRGQALLGLADQVPGVVNNDDVFPIFRLTVTHGGRVGDANLELARIGLLLEEDAGDPLSSAEANALIAELRVYRDANGNGTFDPGTDTLITTVSTLALTAGVQTIALPDGDPNLQVAFGTPRTYFVVAQLTANASQQAPNQFRATHLAIGPSATQAEHAPSDIPLTIACPADFASRVIGPVTPVELTGFTVE